MKAESENTPNGISFSDAALGAAAGLRILDGVRMLGRSLAKLYEMSIEDLKDEKAVSSAPNIGRPTRPSVLKCPLRIRSNSPVSLPSFVNLSPTLQPVRV